MRKRYRLTAAKVAAIRKPGRHADGGNLILRVSKEGHKTWGFRYALDGRARTAGLGPLHRVTLAEAREKAEAMGKALAAGLDPIDERDKARQAERATAARLLTFREAARRFLIDREGGWRSEQHRKDFTNSLDMHILPVIGGLSIADVDTPAVLKVLERDNFWRAKPETASRCRARIEQILDWAAAREYRAGKNPAAWRGHLDHILPAPKTLAPVKHHPALPWAELPAFMAGLRGRDSVQARTLEFLVLTAVRLGDALQARWEQIDLSGKTWTIPITKSGKPHTVPLAPRALEILRTMPRDGERTFLISKPAMGVFLRKTLARPDVTIHGFRATFATWAAERTNYPEELREAALAHAVKGGATQAAYQRGELLQRRRKLMEAWATYCASPAARSDIKGKIVALRG